MTISEGRRQFALKTFQQYPDKVDAHVQDLILKQQVVFGMTPYEAYLAAGAFAFKVIPDPKRWRSNADPYKVMWAQSIEPDNSEISMIFENTTQYPQTGQRTFRVLFKKGKAVSIEQLPREQRQ